MMSPNQENKKMVWELFQKIGKMTPENMREVLSQYFAEQTELDCFHPINSIYGQENICQNFWEPLMYSFSKIAVRPYVFFGGKSVGSDNHRFRDTYWVTATGYMEGLFDHDYLDIPANGKFIFLRFCIMLMIDKGKIHYVRLMPDYMDLMRQAGISYVHSDGNEFHIPGPYTQDGIILDERDPEEGKKSVDTLLTWSYVERSRVFEYQSENFHWYGPACIGTCIGMDDYCKHHRNPWLAAFPDRCTLGNQEFMYLGEGNYCAVGTWTKAVEYPADQDVYMTQTGKYLGVPPTGNQLAIRDYDWYRIAEDGRITDNWCIIDMPHLFLQIGVDIFGKLKNKDYTPIDL